MTIIRLTKTTIGLEVYVDTLPNVTHFTSCHLVAALE